MADYSALNDPMMAEILESFLVETREILEKLDVDLMELENRPDDKDLLNEIFRSFHTIKGTSGFLGLVKLQKVTHRCEDLLNKLRKGEISLNEDIMDAILLAYDTIKALVDVIEANKNEDYDTTEVVEKLSNLIESLNASGGSASAEKSSEEKPADEEKAKQPEEQAEEKPAEEVEEKKEEGEAETTPPKKK